MISLNTVSRESAFVVISVFVKPKSVFTHMTTSYTNLLDQKKVFIHKKKVQLTKDWFGKQTWLLFHNSTLLWDNTLQKTLRGSTFYQNH